MPDRTFSADLALPSARRLNQNLTVIVTGEIRRLINKDGLVEVNDYANLEKYKILSKKFKYLKMEDKFIIRPNINKNY